MPATKRTHHHKLASRLALITFAALLLAGIGVLPAIGDTGIDAWPASANLDELRSAGPNLPDDNVAPDQAVLVHPADDALGLWDTPALDVIVSDPDPADTLEVNFYGRVSQDFTIVAIPDSQHYASAFPQLYIDHLQWIATHKTASKIAFATSVGDLVNIAASTIEWARADAAFATLDEGNVPYSVGPGNHDLYGLYENYFGVSRFSGKPWYGGNYSGDNYNNYSLFSAAGMDFILINLQYDTTNDHFARLEWADGLLKANPNRRGILVQHNVLNLNDTWSDYRVYVVLKDNPNLFLVLCGHMHHPLDGAAYLAAIGDDGHTIHVVLANYQDFIDSGNLRLLRFSPADDMIYMTTYSPITDSYLTTDPDRKNLPYDMADGGAFELIGTDTGVSNGATASIPWPGLAQGIEYEWTAVVSDGSQSTVNPTWSFTTAALPKAPVVTSIAQGESDIDLGWQGVTRDVTERPTTIIEYRVYGGQEPYFTSGALLTPSSSTPGFTHAGGSTGTTNWYYLVRAMNVAGESAASTRRVGRFAFTLVEGSMP